MLSHDHVNEMYISDASSEPSRFVGLHSFHQKLRMDPRTRNIVFCGLVVVLDTVPLALRSLTAEVADSTGTMMHMDPRTECSNVTR